MSLATTAVMALPTLPFTARLAEPAEPEEQACSTGGSRTREKGLVIAVVILSLVLAGNFVLWCVVQFSGKHKQPASGRRQDIEAGAQLEDRLKPRTQPVSRSRSLGTRDEWRSRDARPRAHRPARTWGARARGRGQQPWPSPVDAAALEFSPETLRREVLARREVPLPPPERRGAEGDSFDRILHNVERNPPKARPSQSRACRQMERYDQQPRPVHYDGEGNYEYPRQAS